MSHHHQSIKMFSSSSSSSTKRKIGKNKCEFFYKIKNQVQNINKQADDATVGATLSLILCLASKFFTPLYIYFIRARKSFSFHAKLHIICECMRAMAAALTLFTPCVYLHATTSQPTHNTMAKEHK